MNAYENAPATAMLATHCAVCSRPLLDATSVELGIGPECRKKHGFGIEAPDEARAEANKIVHWIAVHQDSGEVRERIVRLHGLGFAKLAERIAERVGCVRIEVEGDFVHVRAPYDEAHVERMRRVPGRRFVRNGKDVYDRVPVASKRALWGALVASFAGRLGISPRGMFVVGETGGAS